MTAQALVAAVEAIAATEPTYRLGGTGADGTCDCVGLVMGAMQRIRPTGFPLHSSNYFARWQMAGLERIPGAALVPGMLVYKARADAGGLNARYRAGGSHYNGDPLDYYHVGVVCGVSPLRIVHCTSAGGRGGIFRTGSLSGWTHAGRLRSVAYQEEEMNGMEANERATVVTPDGNPLKLRPTPGTDKPYIAKMPNGATVQLHADAEGWAKVTWQGVTGYCMSRFLQKEQPVQSETPPWGAQVLEKLNRVLVLLGGEGDG